MKKLNKALALALCLMLLVPATLALANTVSDAPEGATNDVMADLPVEGAETPVPTNTPRPTATPRVTATPRPQVLANNDNVPTFNSLDTVGVGFAQDITKDCKFKLSEGKMAPMIDNKLKTAWVSKKAKAKIQITIPSSERAGGLYIEWAKKPGDFSIVEYDSANNELANSGRNISYIGLVNFYSLTENTSRVVLQFAKKGAQISKLTVLGAGNLPPAVQNFKRPATKADLMVLVARQGDEFVYMGGTIPYYTAAMGRQVQVVYMANGGRETSKEALTGLWAAGAKNYPDFIGFSNKAVKTLKDASKLWNAGKTREALVDRIRRYKPEVIVTNALAGENGDGARALTATIVQEAVEQAADSTKYSKSADKYGTWEVKKLYLHQSAENQISMNWIDACPELDGRSPSELSRTGYAAYKTISKAVQYEEGGKFDNSQFGLVHTTVGEDIAKNDFLENIPETADDTSINLNTDMDDYDVDEFPDADVSDLDDSFDYEELLPEDNNDDLVALTNPEGGFTPPTDTAPQNDDLFKRIGLFAGVPLLLGGGAFGYARGKKLAKKNRRAQRRIQRQTEPSADEPVLVEAPISSDTTEL